MQVTILILLIMVFLLMVCLIVFSAFAGMAIIRIADKLDVEIPFLKSYRRKCEEMRKDEEKNEKFDQMLKELSEKKIVSSPEYEESGSYNELDVFEAIEKTEDEPESIMTLLEFGLPDEELQIILNQLNSDT